MMSLARYRLLPLFAAATALAACSGGGKRPPPAAAAAPATGEIDAIAALLDQGKVSAARKRLRAELKRQPMEPRAMLLLDSIERNPIDLLGPESFAHVVQPGETMVSLAQRFLGNRLKAFQLARYNKIERPADLVAGQTIRIPGKAPQPAPVARPEPRPAPAKPRPAPVKPATRPVAPPPAAPATNPAAARQARAAGLAALNQGNVARALAQLRRAAALDPGNPMIARDLQRAERIAATVRSRR